jgi:hypothetical protein
MARVLQKTQSVSMVISISIQGAFFSMVPRRKVSGQSRRAFKDRLGLQEAMERMDRMERQLHHPTSVTPLDRWGQLVQPGHKVCQVFKALKERRER